MTKFSLNKVALTTISLAGAMGVLATLSPSAQAQQARVSGAAVIDDGSGISAVAGEAILAPGQLLDDDDITVSPNFNALTSTPGSGSDFTIDELDIDFTLDTTTTINPLEQEIAAAVSDAPFANVSDVISLVEAFGTGVNATQGQAEVTGAVAFENDNFTSAVAVQAELAPGQLLADNIGEGDPAINIDPSPAAGIAIDFDTLASTSGALESEISNTIDTAFFAGNGTFLPGDFSATESDIVSLVNAFNPNQNGEVGQARITGAATFDNGQRLSALASEAELAPGQGLDPATVSGIVPSAVPSTPALASDGAVAFIGGPSNSENFLDQGNLVFAIDNSINGGSLEEAIVDTVAAGDFSANSDATSLVEAFTSGSDDSEEIFSNIPDAASDGPSVSLD